MNNWNENAVARANEQKYFALATKTHKLNAEVTTLIYLLRRSQPIANIIKEDVMLRQQINIVISLIT